MIGPLELSVDNLNTMTEKWEEMENLIQFVRDIKAKIIVELKLKTYG